MSGTLDVNTDATIATLQVEDLTAGRVVLAGTSGEIEDSTNLTFDGTLLTVTGNTTVTGNVETPNLFTSIIDSSDSSEITFVPAVRLNSDLNVENNATFDNNITTSTLTVTGDSEIQGDLTLGGNITIGDAISNSTLTVIGSTEIPNLFTSIIDSSDSSEITVVPSIRLNSDLNVENNATFDNNITTSTLTVTGNAEFDTNINTETFTATGNVEAPNLFTSIIDSNDSSAITVVPALILNSDLNVENNATFDNNITTSTLTVTGNAEIQGDLTLGGNITIGDATTDSITINADLESDIIPDQSGVYSLGSETKRWKFVYTDDITIANGTASTFDIGNIQIGTTTPNTIDTNQGGLIFDSLANTSTFNDELIVNDVSTFNDDVTIDANLEVTGDITLGGNITLGDQQTDSIVISADFESSLIPNASNFYDLGTLSKKWRDLQIKNVNAESLNASVNVAVGTDKFTIDATTGDTITKGSLEVQGNLDVQTTATINEVGSDLIPDVDGTRNLGSATNRWASLYVSGQTIFLGGLKMQDDGSGNLQITTASGNLTDFIADTITGNELVIDDIYINDTTIQTTVSDANLELLANGAGIIDLLSNTKTPSLQVSDLTAGRVILSGTDGEIEDSTNLTFDGTLLDVTGNVAVSGTLDVNTSATIATLQVEDLTAGRVVLAGTDGEIEDSTNLTFDGTTLTVTGEAVIDDITINNSTISTTSGSLVLDPTPAGSAGTVTIQGDLQVMGTTTTINSEVTTLDDPIITLGGDTAPNTDDTKDRGVEFQWHTGTTAKVGFFGFDRSEEAFTFIADATNAAEVFSGTPGNVVLGNISAVNATLSGNGDITGTLDVTGLSTLASVDINGGNIDATAIGETLRSTGKFTVLDANNITTNSFNVNNMTVNQDITVIGEIYGDGLNTDDIRVAGNRIQTTGSNADLEIITAGTGTVELLSDTNVTGNLGVSTEAILASAKVSDLTSGRVVLAGTDGELEDSVNLTFDSSDLTVGGGLNIAGDISPSITGTYNIGSEANTFANIFADNISISSGIDAVTLNTGNITLGVDTANTISTITGDLILSSDTNTVQILSSVYANSFETDNILVSGNTISTTNSDADLEFTPSGSGIVSVSSDLNSTGTVTAENFVSSGAGVPTIESATNIVLDAGNAVIANINDTEFVNISSSGTQFSQGNVTVSNTLNVLGNTILGNTDTDTVNVAADFISSLIPNATGQFDLGASTKRWNTLHIDNVTAAGSISATQGFTGDLTGNADTATILSTARDFSITGAVATSSNVSFDGSGAVVLTVTQQNDSVTLGTHTTGNYVATIADAGSSNLVVANSGTETAAVTLDLSNTGVTANTYGDSSNIPSITVDAKGRITGITTNAVATELTISDGTTTDTVDLISDTLSVIGTANEVTTAVTDNQIQIGLPNSVQIATNLTVGNTLTVTGDLVVNGSTTTVNSTVVTIDDPVFTLGGDTAPSSSDSKDRGIEFKYHTGIEARDGFFGFDESTNRFTFIPNATNTAEVFTGDAGDAQFGEVFATTFHGNVEGNIAGTSDAFSSAVTIALGGVLSGSATFTEAGDTATITASYVNNSITLGTHTTGNYVATLADAGSSNIVVANSGTETAAVTVDLSDTGVVAATKGSATEIPVITVDAKGRVTSLTGTAITTELDVGADSGTDQTIVLGTDKLTISGGTGLSTSTGTDTVQITLDDTAVDISSKSTFGSESLIPVVTVNQQGQITGITEQSVATTLSITDGTTSDTVDLIDDTLTFSATENETTVVVSDNKVTVGLPDNVTISNNLIVENNGFVKGIFGDDINYIFDPDNSKYAFGLANISNMIGDFEVKSENIVLGTYQNNSLLSASTDGEIIAVANLSDPSATTAINTAQFVVASQNATARVGKGSGAGIAFASEITTGSNNVSVGGIIRTSKVSGTSAENKFNLDIGQVGDTGGVRIIRGDTLADDPTITATFTNSGRLGIGTTEPGSELEVSGNIALSGSVLSTGSNNSINLDYDTPGDDIKNILIKSEKGAYVLLDYNNTTVGSKFAIFANTDSVGQDGDALLLVDELGDVDVKNDLTVGNNLTIVGNLAIQGDSFTIDSETTVTEDPVLRIGVSGLSQSDGKDRGIEFLHWDTSAKRGFFGHDESTGRFTYKPNTTNTSEVFTGTAGDAEFTRVYADITGNVTGQVSSLANHTTADLTEDTQLYFTTARARGSVDVIDNGGDGSLTYSSTSGNFTYTGPSAAETRAHFSASGDLTYAEGTGVFSVTTYKTADFNTDFDNKSTTDLTEGTKLYYTNARARGAITVTDSGGDGELLYDTNTGVITYQGPTASETRAHFSAGGDLSYNSSTGVFSYTERTDAQIRALFSGSDPITYNATTGAFGFDNTNTGFVTKDYFSAGTGVTYNANTGEISIGQDVSTTADVEFNNVTVAGQLITDDITVATVTASGNVIVQGNLTVEGTTTTVNSTEVEIADKNIVIAKGSTDAATANGAGLTVDGADAEFTYTSVDDRWNLNKDLNVPNIYATSVTGDILATDGTKILENGADGTDAILTGQVTDISNHDTDELSEGTTNQYFTDARARLAISATGDLTYDNQTGELGVTTYKSTDFDTDFADKEVGELSDINITDIQPGQYLRYGGVIGDVHYNNVVLLLPFNGNDGDTTTTDESSLENIITFNGGAEIDQNIKKFGSGSFLGNGVDSFVSTTLPGGVGSSDFTIEFWVYYDSVVSGMLFNSRTGGTAGDGIDINSSLLVRNDAGNIMNTVSLDTNTWYYISLSRVGNTLYRHVNGTINATATFQEELTGEDILLGGSNVGNTGFMTGNIDDFRITNGTGRYDINGYTVPSRQHFTFAGSAGTEFENVTPSISDLIDVDLTSINNNDILVYDAFDQTFKPGFSVSIGEISGSVEVTENLTVAGSIVGGSNLELNEISIRGNKIETNNSNASVEIGTSGTGTVELLDSTNITGDATVSGTLRANGTGNSLLVADTLRIDQSGSGLRMTNVGAFDNDGTDNFRIYATNTLFLRANGESGGGIVIDATNQNVSVENNLIATNDLTVQGNSTVANLTVEDLTVGRVVYTDTDGRLIDSGNLAFDGSILTVTGDASVSGAFDANSVTVDTLTDTRLVLAGVNGILEDDARLTFDNGLLQVDANAQVTGNLEVNGNVDLGLTTDQTITFNGRVDSSIVPSVDTTYDLGTSDLRWNDLYLAGNSVFLGGITLSQGSGGLSVTVGDSGTLTNISGNRGLYNSIEAGSIQIDTNVITTIDSDADIEIRTSGAGTIELQDSTNITGSATISSTLDVDGQATIASLNVEDLTDNRIVIAGTTGEIEDDANFTFDGTTFNIGATGEFTVAVASGNTQVKGTLDVDGQTTVASLNVEDLTADRITFTTTNGEIKDSANLTFDDSTLALTGDADITGSLDVDDIKIDGTTISSTTGGIIIDPDTTTDGGTVTIAGNLTVSGTTTTVDSTVVTIDDPVFTLGGDTAPTVNDAKDRGIEFRWYSDTDTQAKLGFFGFDDSTGRFAFRPDTTNTNEVFAGPLGDLDINDIYAQDIAAASLTLTTDLEVQYGGTGASTFTAKGILYGNDAGAIQVTAAAGTSDATTSNEILTVDANGVPVWTDVIDEGEY